MGEEIKSDVTNGSRAELTRFVTHIAKLQIVIPVAVQSILTLAEKVLVEEGKLARRKVRLNEASKGIRAIIPEAKDVTEHHPGMITELRYNWHQIGDIRDTGVGEDYYQYIVCKGGVTAIHRMNGYFRVEFESGEYRDVYNPNEVVTMPYKSSDEIIEDAFEKKKKILFKLKRNTEWMDLAEDAHLDFEIFDYCLK